MNQLNKTDFIEMFKVLSFKEQVETLSELVKIVLYKGYEFKCEIDVMNQNIALANEFLKSNTSKGKYKTAVNMITDDNKFKCVSFETKHLKL